MSANAALLLSYKYDQVIRMQAQQRQSALEMAVLRSPSDGERMRHTLVGKVTPTQVTGRNVLTPLTAVPLDDRWSVTQQWVAADLIDEFDKLRTTLTDVNSAYIRGITAGMNRTKDVLILAAASGTAVTGQTGTGTQTLPTSQKVVADGSVSGGIAAHYFDEGKGSGNVGLTYYKLLVAKMLLEQQYGQDAVGKIHCAVTAQEKNTLVASTKLSSQLFVPGEAVMFMNNQVPSYLGVNFHLVADEMLLTGTTTPGDGGTNRFIYVWYEDGIALDINEDLIVRIDQRVDMNMAWQPYARWMMGAVRLDDKAVVQISCDPTTPF